MIRIYKEREIHKRVPLFAGMSIIEKFIMITAPVFIIFILYILLDFTGYLQWIRLGMSIGITIILWVLIYFFASFMSRRDLY